MDSTSLDTLCEEHLTAARAHSSRRSAHTVYGGQGHALRQTLIALVAGQRLGEHDSPPEATLQVLRGAVTLHAGEDRWDGDAGDLVVIPSERHDLEAREDAVVLLTVALHGQPGT